MSKSISGNATTHRRWLKLPLHRTVQRKAIIIKYLWYRAFQVAQIVKNLPAMWETWVQSLCWEDLLEKKLASHSSILAWRIPWTEEPGRQECMGSKRVGHDWVTHAHTHTHTHIYGTSQGNGNDMRPTAVWGDSMVSWNARDELLSWEGECFSAAFILMGSRKTKLF